MGCVRTICLVVGVLVLAGGLAQADIITINGDDDDWSSPDTTNNDPDETTRQGYDIDYNYFEWDYDSDHVCFMFQTYAVMPDDTGWDYACILINTDSDAGTGGPVIDVGGMEYYIQWDLGATDPVTLYEWIDPSWSPVSSPDYLEVARGDVGTDYTIVEWAVDADDIGYPATFLWGAYLDNGGVGTDDFCPDDSDQPGYTPEPTSMILLPITLAAVGLWRRRAAGKKS